MSYKNDSNKRGQILELFEKKEWRKSEEKGKKRERGEKNCESKDSIEPTSGSSCEGPGTEPAVGDVVSATTLLSLGYLVRESSSQTLQNNSTNLHAAPQHNDNCQQKAMLKFSVMAANPSCLEHNMWLASLAYTEVQNG